MGQHGVRWQPAALHSLSNRRFSSSRGQELSVILAYLQQKSGIWQDTVGWQIKGEKTCLGYTVLLPWLGSTSKGASLQINKKFFWRLTLALMGVVFSRMILNHPEYKVSWNALILRPSQPNWTPIEDLELTLFRQRPLGRIELQMLPLFVVWILNFFVGSGKQTKIFKAVQHWAPDHLVPHEPENRSIRKQIVKFWRTDSWILPKSFIMI